MHDEEATWRVRLSGARGVVGAGILVARDKVLTCAHVVASAVGLPGQPADPPTSEVRLHFPGLQDGRSAGSASTDAVVSSWWPDDDCALLAVRGGVPAGVSPAVLEQRDSIVGQSVRAFGHPRGIDGGLWSRGQLVGHGGPDPSWIQFDGQDRVGRRIEQGFSGAGVLDEGNRVVGMVVAADSSESARVAWMIPARALLELLGTSGAGPPAPRPPKGPVSWEDALCVAEALYAVPVMRSSDARQQILQTLPPDVSSAIPRFAMSKMDLFSAVRTCLDHEGSLTVLVNAVTRFEGADSAPVARLMSLIRRLGLDAA